MKKLILLNRRGYYVVLILLLLTTACKKTNYLVFNDDATVYFYDEAQIAADTVKTAAMGYISGDTILKLPVRLLGKAATSDRKYACIVFEDSTTAVEGNDFSLEGNEFTIRANGFVDTVRLKVFNKHLSLVEKDRVVLIKIIENEHFKGLILKDKWEDVLAGSRDNYNYGTYASKIRISYHVEPPIFWDDPAYVPYLGKYSVTKVRAFVQWTGLDLRKFIYNDASSKLSASAIQNYATAFSAYLSDRYKAGAPILDEDGLPMQMGDRLKYSL